MAARTVSAHFLSVFQRSTFCSTLQPFTASRQTAAIAAERCVSGGSFFSNRGLHSEAQAREDNKETHEYENEKMTAEGGGSVEQTFHEKSEEVKQKGGQIAEEVEGKAGEAANEAKSQVSKNADTAKDMFQDFPQKVSETATGLKEVGVEAGKAVKRDAEKIAQKVGLKSE